MYFTIDYKYIIERKASPVVFGICKISACWRSIQFVISMSMNTWYSD